MDKSFQASWGSRLCVLLFVAPCVGLFFWVGFEIASRQNILVGLIFVLVAVFLSIWIAFMLTMRIDMSDDSIVRTWLLGRKVVPIHDITTLRWGGARGQTILSIVYGKSRRFITISSIVVSREKLLGIQKDVLAARGLEGEVLWPPMAAYVDIDKMLERKHPETKFG
ncbi:hypothetical protein [Rhodanobacter sp. DHG33]|uniref:hypothetical protein n=1 Tax=Rhodanobacter sp. DHG33 TaxID=2775921 RepID=UPI00178422E0|nr:hypothetical protein [Rhodanobacter sp. DHG33]MBD8900191.1 hypothetical protein [Rhodanobacter sp. DHG33]